jgi:hypothetical protein
MAGKSVSSEPNAVRMVSFKYCAFFFSRSAIAAPIFPSVSLRLAASVISCVFARARQRWRSLCIVRKTGMSFSRSRFH